MKSAAQPSCTSTVLGVVQSGMLSALLASCLLTTGCQSSLFGSRGKPQLLRAQVAGSPDQSPDRPSGQITRASWSGESPLLPAREKTTFEKLTPWIKRPVQRTPAELAVAIDEGLRELDAAKKLKDAQQYDEAARTFGAIAKKFKNTPAEEEALFLRAECFFETKKYPKAQDGYDELFQRYPGSRFTETSTRRLFKIAQIWLKEPVVVSTNDVQPVSFESRGTPQSDVTLPPPPSQPPLIPNVFDRSRPVFDTEGRALQALKSIWMHDPVGALADDALMLTASYHLRKGEFIEADHALNLLREEYPKSPHLEDAFVLGSHVKLMTYQGAEYEDLALEKSEELKQSTLRLFPNIQHRERLQQELQRIEAAKAARAWENLSFWRKKDHQAAAVYATLLIEEFPTSEYADRAREILYELKPEAKSHLWRDVAAAGSEPFDPIQTPSQSNSPSEAAPEQPVPRRFFPDDPEPVPDRANQAGDADSTGRAKL